MLLRLLLWVPRNIVVSSQGLLLLLGIMRDCVLHLLDLGLSLVCPQALLVRLWISISDPVLIGVGYLLYVLKGPLLLLS